MNTSSSKICQLLGLFRPPEVHIALRQQTSSMATSKSQDPSRFFQEYRTYLFPSPKFLSYDHMYKSTLRCNVVPVHAMRGFCTAALIFKSVGLLEGSERSASRSGQFAPRGKQPLVPTHRWLCGPQSWSGHSKEHETLGNTTTIGWPSRPLSSHCTDCDFMYITNMIWYDMIWYDMIGYDIFNCNWVTTRWQ
jgi:hypothetical protein